MMEMAMIRTTIPIGLGLLLAATVLMAFGNIAVAQGCPKFEVVTQGGSPADPKTGRSATIEVGPNFGPRQIYDEVLNERIRKALAGSKEDSEWLAYSWKYGYRRDVLAAGDQDKWRAHAHCLGLAGEQGIEDLRPFMTTTKFVCGNTKVEVTKTCLAGGLKNVPCYSQVIRLDDGRQERIYFVFDPTGLDRRRYTLFVERIFCAPVKNYDLIKFVYATGGHCLECARSDYYIGSRYLGSLGSGFAKVSNWPAPQPEPGLDFYVYPQIMPHYRKIEEKDLTFFNSLLRQSRMTTCRVDLYDGPAISRPRNDD